MSQISQLFESAKVLYDNGDPSHDIAHIKRVMATCERIGKIESADIRVLLPAALLHDVVNLAKNHPERLQASEMAAARSRELLEQCKYTDDEINRICAVIAEHSYSAAKKPSTLESAILQDADKLDALGAIGIMRTVTCGSRMGASYYHMDEPFAVQRSLDDKTFTLDHFFAKLLKLPALMNTKTGRQEALTRVEFMNQFLGQLKREIVHTLADWKDNED